VNSLMLSTPYVSCHSYYSGDFRIHSDSLFADDFWSVVTQFWWRFHASPMTMFSLLISFVNRELACVVDSVRQPWLSFKHDFSFYSDSIFADDFWISTGIEGLTIPCVKQEFIFATGFTPRSWILWRCRLHTSAATHITVAISGSKVTLF
jgi:hypothetical protein